MKLYSILAAVSLLAAPGRAAAQAHGVGGMTARSASLPGAAHLTPLVGAAGAHTGAVRVGFGGGRFDHHPGFHDGFHDRFRHRHDAVLLYPYWGWSDCAFDGECDWGGSDPAPGLTPADYVDPPAPPLAREAPHHVDVNECSDWVWNARQHRSICKTPFHG